MQSSLRTEFQLTGLRSRNIRLHCVIKSVIFVYEWNCLNLLLHLLFSTGHHAGRCGQTRRDSCDSTGEECWDSLWEWDVVQMKLGRSTRKGRSDAAKSSLQSTSWQTGAISSGNASSRWCKEYELCSRTAGQSVFLNGPHGFAQIQREVRVVPKSDGAIHRICKFLCKHLFIFEFLPVPFVIGWQA